MPYIRSERREEIADIVDRADDLLDVGAKLESPGDLNYAITMIIMGFIEAGDLPLWYQKINDVLGALEGAKLEFYRRVAAPFEVGKSIENGDVY